MSKSADRDCRSRNLLHQVAKIVSAYVSNNSTTLDSVTKLIAESHLALRTLSDARADLDFEALEPAVPISKSITAEFIICLDDGRKLKSLKRHLGVLGMTPDEYRAKWRLADDYPMVASSYAAKRSAIAKSSGFGARDRK